MRPRIDHEASALGLMGIWVSSQGESRQDEAHGMAWYGSVSRGEAKHDNAGRGKARYDKTMQVKARQCNRFGVYGASGCPGIIQR